LCLKSRESILPSPFTWMIKATEIDAQKEYRLLLKLKYTMCE